MTTTAQEPFSEVKFVRGENRPCPSCRVCLWPPPKHGKHLCHQWAHVDVQCSQCYHCVVHHNLPRRDN